MPQLVSLAMKVRSQSERKEFKARILSHWKSLMPSLRLMIQEDGSSQVSPNQSAIRSVPGADSETLGQAVLETYFVQILRAEHWVLDFGPKAWARTPDLVWSPSQLFHTPSREFSSAVSDLYCGFYRDDRARFKHALKDLSLEPAEQIFLEHFGLEDQRRVAFRLKDLQATFNRVFEVCAKNDVKLSPEFGVLGFCLLGLYQTLEEENGVYDVRVAFDRAWNGVP